MFSRDRLVRNNKQLSLFYISARLQNERKRHSEYLLLECAQIGISSQVGAITSCLHVVKSVSVFLLHGLPTLKLTTQGIALSLENPHVPIQGLRQYHELVRAGRVPEMEIDVR
jgi:hypothetical protein